MVIKGNNNGLINKKNFRFVGSGKAAISLIFRYLAEEKNYNPKYDEVLVPKWMGNWVYSQIHQVAFPSPSISKNTKVIFLYHQFGIPQIINNIIEFSDENKLTIVEDCAHVLEGSYKTHSIGNIGDYTIYSFSKFIECGALGGVASTTEPFLKYIDDKIKYSPRYIKDLSACILKYISLVGINESHSSKIWNMYYSLCNFSYRPLKKAIKKVRNQIESEKKIRSSRLNQIRKELSSSEVLSYDTGENYVPFTVPLVITGKKITEIQKKFMQHGFFINKVKFDINRNMLNSDYKNSLMLDIGSKNESFSDHLEIICKTL